MILEDHERQKFAAYLRQRIHDNQLAAEQLAKLGHPGEVIAKHERVETLAMEVVARMLESMEGVTVSSGSL